MDLDGGNLFLLVYNREGGNSLTSNVTNFVNHTTNECIDTRATLGLKEL